MHAEARPAWTARPPRAWRRWCPWWRTPGCRHRATAAGSRAAAPTSPTSGRLSTSSMTLAMNRLAIRPQTRSGRSANSSGPGLRPYCWKPASIIAAVAEVGRPSVSSGTSVPAAEALLAASGPATPSIAPWPNSSGCLVEPLLGRIGQEGRDLGAAGRQRADREAEQRAAQPRPSTSASSPPWSSRASRAPARASPRRRWRREAT